MKSEISATEAARRFSEILNRVRYRNESFVVKRGGVPVCEIVPVRGRKGDSMVLARKSGESRKPNP